MAVVVYSTLSPLRRTLNGDDNTDAPVSVRETNDDSDSDDSDSPKRDLASEFEQAATERGGSGTDSRISTTATQNPGGSANVLIYSTLELCSNPRVLR